MLESVLSWSVFPRLCLCTVSRLQRKVGGHWISPSSWPRPNRWLQRRLFATQYRTITWQEKLALTTPENTEHSRWKDIALVTCVGYFFGFGAHLHSLLTLEDARTDTVVRPVALPVPSADSATPHSPCTISARTCTSGSDPRDAVWRQSVAALTHCRCRSKQRKGQISVATLCRNLFILFGFFWSGYLNNLGLLSTKLSFFRLSNTNKTSVLPAVIIALVLHFSR